MARTMGATLVGMSTVLEAIAARHLNAEVLGLSLVSTHAAGVTPGHLNHLEVLEAGQSAAASLGALLTRVVPVLWSTRFVIKCGRRSRAIPTSSTARRCRDYSTAVT